MRVQLGIVSLVVSSALVVPVHAAGAKPSPYRATPIAGSWVVSGCVVTGPPSQVGFPFTIPSRCLGEVTNSWVGSYVADELGTIDSSLSVDSFGVLTLSGRAADGTCGTLRITSHLKVKGSNDEATSVATILSGTGDWAGSRGSYKTTGTFDSGVGTGEYHGTWLRPRSAPTSRSTPCVPPPPAP